MECGFVRTVLEFDMQNSIDLPFRFQADDVRFSDSFAEYFINHFSKPGDMVFDPFAGFGTTLYAAEKLGRKAFGIEYISERVEFIKTIITKPNNIIHGDALRLDEIDLPVIDFLLTSPPYMRKSNHPEYPFAGYKITGQSYDDYLNDISDMFRRTIKQLAPNAHVVIEISNLIIENEFTPLAWDVAKSINEILPLKHEIIIVWRNDEAPTYGFGYDHSYALIFKLPSS